MEKDNAVYRVAVVGDSFVEAFQVELPETFPKIAERELAAKGYSVQMMNFGRSGFTTTEELLVVRDEVMKFSPDLVVLFFVTGNDIRDVTRELSLVADARPFFLYDDVTGELSLDFRIKSLINPLKQNSALASLLTQRYNVLKRHLRKRKMRKAMKESVQTGYQSSRITGTQSLATSSPDPRYQHAFNMNKVLITEIARIVKERAGMMLVTKESSGWKTTDEKSLQSIDASFDPFYFEDTLRELAMREEVHYLGLQRRFRKDWVDNQR